jgi:hypothetical protein
MDDDLRELEAELKRLEPAAPSRRLWERVGAELAGRPAREPRAGISWLWAILLPAGAAAGVFLLPQFFGPAPAGHSSADAPPAGLTAATAQEAGGTPLKPVAAEKLLVSADDEGIVTLADGTQARRARLHFLDTITWRNDRTNTSLTWSIPREEVRVVPIALQ